MRKITHSKFELDLSPFKLTDVEQNSIFADNLYSKTTFPFEVFVDDHLDIALDFIKSYTTSPETRYEVIYSHFDKLSKAILNIEEFVDGKISCVLEYGLEDFPSWDKNLRELNLENFELPEGTDIYEHAETIINQTYPAVNYNFPQVHTDKIDTEEEVWAAFEKIINNRKDGAFLINEVDEEDITYNRNIMQPMPYWLHVLKTGCADAGYTLTGDILTDERIIDRVMYGDVEYFNRVDQESMSIILMSEDFTTEGQTSSSGPNLLNSSIASEDYQKYIRVQNIANPGKYRIVGDVWLYPFLNFTCYVRIKYRNSIIYQKQFGFATFYLSKIRCKVNIVFETLVDLSPNDITIEIYHRRTTEKIIAQLDINPIRLHDESGTAIANIINLNEINLTRSVPDITFGDAVKIIKNWFNYNFYTEGTNVVMNKIEVNSATTEVIDLRDTEVRWPSRKFQKGMSFLLKFADVDSKEFSFLPVFQNSEGISNTGFTENQDTKPIEINALPLPLLLRNEVQTAYAFENNTSKAYFIKYDGLVDGKNLSKDCSDLLLPVVHAESWFDWMNFRINATSFKWPFKASIMKMLNLSVNKEVYAYDNVHLIKQITRTEITENFFEYEIETESKT